MIEKEKLRHTILEIIKSMVLLTVGGAATVFVKDFLPLLDDLSPRLFLSIVILLLAGIAALVSWIFLLKKELNNLNNEITKLKTELEGKFILTFKFGIKWDKNFNPHCPKCENHTIGYVLDSDNQWGFLCDNCEKHNPIMDGAKNLTYEQALEKLKGGK